MSMVTWFTHGCPESLEQLSLKTWYISIPSDDLAECLDTFEKPLSICLSGSILTENASFSDYEKTLAEGCEGIWRVWEVLKEYPRSWKEEGRWLYIVRGEDQSVTGFHKGEVIVLEP